MSWETAVKIVLETGEVYFYDDEVMDVIVTPLKHFQVQANESELPHILSEGDSWMVLQIRIRETKADTKSRVKLVLNDKKEMTVYYALIEDPTKSIKTFLIPDTNEFKYFNGEEAAGVDNQLYFLECE